MTVENKGKIPVGARVEDREDADPNTAIVIRRPEKKAQNWAIPDSEITVADVNENYPSDDPVVCVIFESELRGIPGWNISTCESLWHLVEKHGGQHYAYPESRLKQVGVEIAPRQTDNGNRVIHRLHVTGVGERLIYATDYDGVDHNHGITRDVCFNRKEWDVKEGNLVRVEYEKEKDIGDNYPPLLAGILTIDVLENEASPDSLLDL